uniref:Uncharacterized protein n=1 Tax=viral metagenome TaxID=1070528 RepID=A0A6C0ARJ5_9ZZZZ
MPQKINMFITNGNFIPAQIKSQINTENLAIISGPKSAPLNSSMITRIHNVRPGCGSCGRKN